MFSAEKNPLLSWQFALLKLLLLALVSVGLEKPMGSIAGRIAMEQKGFGLYSYDIKENKVYATAIGPRGSSAVERGVWIKADGSFRIDQLPVGEYELKVRATGFSTEYEHGIFVDEGKVSSLARPVAMQILEPYVNIASNSRVFTTREQPHFWINATGANKATVMVYRQDFISLLNRKDKRISVGSGLDIYRQGKLDPDTFDARSLVETLSRQLSPDSEDSAHCEFKLPRLPAGDYLAVAQVANARGKTDWNAFWFTVSDLGLIVKQSPEFTLVRAIDLNTLHPRPGVDIQVSNRSRDVSLSGPGTVKTGPDGFAKISCPAQTTSSSENQLLFIGRQGHDRAYGGLTFYRSEAEQNKIYFYTDRPIYRLGQTVYYKGITRTLSSGGFQKPQADVPLAVAIEDPDNNEIWHGQLRTNKFGSFHGIFEVPAEGKTGAYQVSITYPNGTMDYERFEVAQYRKPEYQVEVQPLTPRVVAGSKLKVRIKASYYFGAPVRNARVKYSVYASPDWSARSRLVPRPPYYSYYDDWESDDSSYYYDSSGDYITEGYAQTDDAGEALVELDTRRTELPKDGPYGVEFMDKRYKVEAEVTDLSRMSVISSGFSSVTAGNFALFLEPGEYVCKAGEPMSVNFTAVDYDGKPVPNQKILLKLTRWLWDSTQGTYRGQQVEETVTALTGESGKGSTTFQTRSQFPTDTYYVTAESMDNQQHLVFDQTSIWIASASYPYVRTGGDADKEALAIRLDKPVYRPGDIARVMVTAPIAGDEGAEALVSIEGARLYDYRAVPMTATAQLVEIPLKSDYAPNVYVNVTFVGKNHQFYTQEQLIKVSPAEHFLKLDVSTDKAKYKPGESVTYTVHASYADGRPAINTELSLGVVDESIYAIRPETAADIQKFFYNRRPNLVETICSFPEGYSGGPDKIEPRVRKDFKDTAAWLPELLTDDRGIAVASVKLPDNLTTWRATIRAIDSETNIGSTVNKIISTQDLIVRLALPRFFSEGDEGLITAIVHNYTDKAQAVQLSLTASSQFEIAQPLDQRLSVDPEKAERYQWPVKLVRSGAATVMIKAVGQTAGDALERKIPVRPLGLPAFSAKSGELTADDARQTLPVGLSADAAPETASCRLALAASSIGPVLGNFSKLIDYPYGCTEQTMSRLVPSVVAVRLHKELGLPLSPDDEKKFSKVHDQALAKLNQYQHGDGGWGWWENDDSNAYLTAHVMEGFYLLKQAGFETDAERLKQGQGWLHKAVPELYKQLCDPLLAKDVFRDLESRVDLAKMIYSLSLYNEQPPDPVRHWLLRQPQAMPPEALAYLTLGFAKLGDREGSQQFYRQLIALANRSDQMIDWDHTPEMLKRLSKTAVGSDYSYRFTGVESTALALRAVLVADPANSAEIEAIKKWLLLQRDRDGWENTKTTAQVFIALLEEELLSRSKLPTSFQVEWLLSGSPSSEMNLFKFGPDNAYAPESSVDIPITRTPHTLDLHKSGSGRLYYNELTTFFRRLHPGDQIAEKSLPQGVHLRREFFRLTPSAVTSDGKIHFRAQPVAGSTIRAGETVLMKVQLETPVALPYVVLEAPLPSGGEVVADDPRKENLEGGESESFLEGDWGEWWWTHQDILDDRLVFFVTHLPAGKSEFHTMVRMEMPGSFQLSPITVAGMYTNRVRAYSTLDSLKVVEP